MNKQKSFLSFFRDLQKDEFPEIKDLRRAIGAIGKNFPRELELPKKVKTSLIKLSLKNVYFLSYAIRCLVQHLKSQKSRDLEENLIVQIEVQLQLLSAQVESVVYGDNETRERSEAILGILLNNQYREISSIFQELRMISIQNKNQDLVAVLESLTTILNSLNKKLADEVVESSLIDGL